VLIAGELDRLTIPEKPLDVLAQQVVAAASTEDWDENEFFELVLFSLAVPQPHAR
jgi:Lhr-like helicases